MEISVGWAGEYARDKFVIDLTEQDDLPAIFAEARVQMPDPATIPLQAKYALLRVEAERLALMAAMDKHVVGPQDGSAQLDALNARKAQLFEYMTNRYPAAEPVDA